MHDDEERIVQLLASGILDRPCSATMARLAGMDLPRVYRALAALHLRGRVVTLMTDQATPGRGREYVLVGDGVTPPTGPRVDAATAYYRALLGRTAQDDRHPPPPPRRRPARGPAVDVTARARRVRRVVLVVAALALAGGLIVDERWLVLTAGAVVLAICTMQVIHDQGGRGSHAQTCPPRAGADHRQERTP